MADAGSVFEAKIGAMCGFTTEINSAKTDEISLLPNSKTIPTEHPIIFPNPFTSELILRLPYSSNGTSVVITNINGQVVLNRTLIANQTDAVLDVSQTGAGIYFVTIVSNEKRYNFKLIKQ